MAQRPELTAQGDVEMILDVLGDKYSGQLLCAAAEPQSAQALSEAIDAPIATCYRRIDALVDAGLLTCVGHERTGHGKRTNVYRRTIDELELTFTGDLPDCSARERPVEPEPIASYQYD